MTLWGETKERGFLNPSTNIIAWAEHGRAERRKKKKGKKQLHSSTKYYLKAGVVEMEEMEPPVFPIITFYEMYFLLIIKCMVLTLKI